MRRDLEWNEGAAIRIAIESAEFDGLEEGWTDYLNFFGMVAYLHRINELTTEDVRAMFLYWLKQLPPFRPYLSENGYNELYTLLDRLGIE